MESLVVGNPGCEIHEITGVLEKSPVVHQLNSKLFNIGLSLGVSTGNREKIRKKILHFDEMSHIEGLSFFLEDWRTRKIEEAKLTAFIEVLKTHELNEFASLLKNKYGKTEAAKGHSSADTSLIKTQQMHIIKIMPDLIELTDWNVNIKAIMRANEILSITDCSALDALANPAEKTEKFFTMIHNKLPGRPEIYDIVVNAFEGDKLRQTGVSNLLKLKLD